ncbi:PKD domain-containing protein [Chryseobacterium lineare]
MNNQLSDISTQYRKFSKGQYIEYTQFNEFLDFFEDQDRLSRVMLQGVGIVCGFKPNLIYTNRILSSLRLSQGVAVTTDGDLLTLNNTNKVSEDLYVSDLKTIDIESKDYTHFKVYDDFKAKYQAFRNGAGKQIELWELATAQEAGDDFQPINNLTKLEDNYLLLYLESYEKEVKPCRGVDCDNHGVQQIRNLKVLVTTAEGIANILGEDRIQPHPLFIDDIMGYGKQERVIIERLIEGQGIDKKFLSSDVKSLYSTVLKNNDYGRIIFEKINAIAQLIGLPTAYYQDFKNTLESFLTQSAGFQYAYDVVKDLADTYYEIIKLLPKAFTVNLPDVDSFPKHIMLGKLIPSTQLDFSRHQFYNSAVLDDEKSTQKVKLLINRFVQQAQNFRNFPVTDNGNAQIKITPSQKLNLSNKAVPFYYTVNDEFLKSWNFDKTSNRSFRDNLGYNNWLSSDAYVIKPLDFNIDKNSFYNIEGHQGMHYQQAFDLLNQIKNEEQLGFDVMILSLEELVDNKDMFKAYFNEYVEKHPGLEHKRGVERGGTFIIVHESLENPTVFADFSLPYICCTPKVKIGLSLPNTVICSEASRIPFTVIPVNGVVKATVGSDPNGVELDNGKYFFNPKLVNPQLYGQAIGFTVNGKPTNCSIKVIAEPKVKVAIASVVYADGDSTTATVDFTVSGQDFANYAYGWDFWDNGGWVTMNPNARGFVSYTFHNLNPKTIPTIRIRVGNNGCTQEIAIGNWYNVPAAPTVVVDNINFSDGINCCEGSVPVIKAEATGPETVFIRDGSFMVQGQGDGPSTLLYSWTKISGPTATLSGVNSPELEVKDLAAGEYIFQLTVVDVDSGLFAKSQEVVVNVIYEG